MQVLKSSAPMIVTFSGREKETEIQLGDKRAVGPAKRPINRNAKGDEEWRQEVRRDAHMLLTMAALTIVRKSDGEFSLMQIEKTDGRDDFRRERGHVSRRLLQMGRYVEQIPRVDRRLVQHHSTNDQHHSTTNQTNSLI